MALMDNRHGRKLYLELLLSHKQRMSIILKWYFTFNKNDRHYRRR